MHYKQFTGKSLIKFEQNIFVGIDVLSSMNGTNQEINYIYVRKFEKYIFWVSRLQFIELYCKI